MITSSRALKTKYSVLMRVEKPCPILLALATVIFPFSNPSKSQSPFCCIRTLPWWASFEMMAYLGVYYSALGSKIALMSQLLLCSTTSLTTLKAKAPA